MPKNIYKNQKGAVAIMMTILVLASILSITMIANTIILNNLSMNIVQVGATKAFFASEAGTERILYETRKNSLDFLSGGINCATGQNICFDSDSTTAIPKNCVIATNNCISSYFKSMPLANGSMFKLQYDLSAPTTTITSFGVYGDTARNTQIDY